jgi:HK97 family phage prohead protease
MKTLTRLTRAQLESKRRSTISFVEIKASDDDPRSFVGLAAAWSLDEGNDVIHRGAFAQTINRWKQAGGKKVIPLIDQHNYGSVRCVVGKAVELAEVDLGLQAKFTVIEGADGDEILERVKGGFVNGLSIGYRPILFDFEERDDVGFVRHLREVALEEVSLVIWGMNPDALVETDSLKSRLSALESEREELQALLKKKETEEAPAPDVPASADPELLARIRAKVAVLKARRSSPQNSRCA